MTMHVRRNQFSPSRFWLEVGEPPEFWSLGKFGLRAPRVVWQLWLRPRWERFKAWCREWVE